MLKNLKIFQKVATGVLVVFMGLMVLVIIAAYARKSGTTRQDMSEARFVRQEAEAIKKETALLP